MVKIAIIGAGFMGETHAAAYQKMAQAQVTAICDKNEVLGMKFAEKFNCVYYGDFDKMMSGCEMDVIDLCIPTFLHETYTIDAARYKKNIFCEKPVTLSVKKLDRMMAAVKKAGVQMLVGQVVRFWPEYVQAKAIYERGELGDLKAVYASRLSEHPAWSEWYRKVENSGGGLLDLHLHDIDYLCYLLGRVKSVYAVGCKNKDGCFNHVNSILTFECGVSATVEGIIEMTKGYPFTMQLRLVGSKKVYEYIMKAGANLEDVASAKRETVIYEVGILQKQPLDETDAYEIELNHFVNCIESNTPSDIISMNQVRDVLCTIEAINTSLEIGEKVEVSY